MKKVVTLKIMDHEFGKDLWYSKRDLFNNFFGDFYDFIKTHNGEKELKENNITNKKEFLEFAIKWVDYDKGCYDLGFGFHKFFLTPNGDHDIKNQPTDTYLGYLYHNGLYPDFLNFLISFFAYWRNDEGCTSFIPYNKCDNMFISSWAGLVDTGKLFCLDSDTVYFWQSYRVKYCLDHIPGVLLSNTDFDLVSHTEDEIILPEIKVAGYLFKGWHKENDVNSMVVNSVNESCTVYAELERRDYYNYWEKEEKTIKKVEDPNWKCVDPA